MLDNNQLRQQILPMLETAGLITQEKDISNSRKMLVFPTIYSPTNKEETNSDDGGGVKIEDIDF